MYKLIKNIKYRLVIGATIGTMAGGAFGIGLNNAFTADGETPTYPFVRDNIDTYGVTTHKYYIDEVIKGKNNVRTVPPSKQYMTFINNKENTEAINSIELTLYHYLSGEDYGKKYIYSFPSDKLTKEWLEEILNLYEKGDIEYLTKNSIWVNKHSGEVVTNLKNESYYSAELTVETVGPNDIQVIKQSKEDNFLETFWITSSTVIGTCLGSMAGSLWEYKHCMSEIEKSSSKSKKLTKAKK